MTVYLKKQEFEEALARKNLSYEEFARMLGIARTYLSTLKDPEKYDLSPSSDLREKMLKILGLEFDDIFFVRNSRFNDKNIEIQSDGQPKQKSRN